LEKGTTATAVELSCCCTHLEKGDTTDCSNYRGISLLHCYQLHTTFHPISSQFSLQT